MGWSCSWIAVRGKDPDALLTTFGMRLSAEREEIPESRWTAANLPDGWFLVFRSDQCEPQIFKDSALDEIARDCELIRSAIEEHVMFCSTSFWKNGRKVWEIVHDAQRGIYHLESSGELPKIFLDIRTRYFAEQKAEGGEKADVDLIFEIPLQMGVEFTRFRHDQDFPANEPKPFHVLVETAHLQSTIEKKPWWRFW